MAIVQNPIIGAAKKSAGGMVFSRTLDQNVIRAKPITYNDTNSDAQKIARSRMRAASGLAKADSKKALDVLYTKRPFKQTKFSRFLQQILIAVTGGLLAPTYNFNILPTLGNGTHRALVFDLQVANGAGGIAVEWTPNADLSPEEEQADMFMIAFNTTKGQGTSVVNAGAVDDTNYTIPFPSGWQLTDTIVVYVGAYISAIGESSLAYKI